MAAHLTRELVESVEARCQMYQLLTAIRSLVEEQVSPRCAAQWLAEGHALLLKGRRYDWADCRTPDCPSSVPLDPDDKGPLGRSQLESSNRTSSGPECPECHGRQWVPPTPREEYCIRLARLDSRGSTNMLGKAYQQMEQILDLPLAQAQPAVISTKAKLATTIAAALDPERFGAKSEIRHTGSVQLSAGPAFIYGMTDNQLERLSAQGRASLQAIAETQELLDEEARKVIEAELSGESYEPRLPFLTLPALDISARE